MVVGKMGQEKGYLSVINSSFIFQPNDFKFIHSC